MRKRMSKLMSILLTLVMIVGLVPATAHAAGYADAIESIAIDGTVITNVTGTQEGTNWSYDGTRAVPRIYLDNYNGGAIYVKGKSDAVQVGIEIRIKGDCSITAPAEAIKLDANDAGTIIISTDAGSTLTTNSWNGIYNAAKKNPIVEFTGSGKVKINANGGYGIWAQQNPVTDGFAVSGSISVTGLVSLEANAPGSVVTYGYNADGAGVKKVNFDVSGGASVKITKTNASKPNPVVFSPETITVNSGYIKSLSEDGTVFRLYKPVAYTISFEGSNTLISPVTTNDDGTLSSLPTPTAPILGQEFVGWYTAEEGGEKVTTDTVFTSNTTLYARWNDPVVYTISFEGSRTLISPVTTGSDGKLTSLPTPTAPIPGQEFVGWYTAEEGGEKVTTDTVFTSDTTLYARWNKPVEPTVINSVNLTGFAVPSDGDAASDGDPAATAESGKGYTFAYGTWFDSTGSTQFNGEFEAGETYIALLALRAEEGYEFAPTGSISATVKDANGNTLTVKSVSVGNASRANDAATVKVEFTIPAEGGETPVPEVTVTPEIVYDEDDFTVEATGDGTVILYVDGEEVTNPYTFEQGEEAVTYVITATAQAEGKEISEVATLEVTVPAKESSDDDVVEPSVTLNKETLSLVVSGTEQLIATVKVPEGMAYALSWASDDNTVATVDEDGNVTAEGVGTATITVTLMPGAVPTAEDEVGYPTASCLVTVTEKETEAETYTVTVENGSGDGEYEAGEPVTIKADSKSGYKFDKWIVESDVEVEIDVNDSETTFTMPAGNVKVTADYDKISSGSSSSGGSTKYKVTLEDTDNGTVESSRTKASKGTTVTITVDPEAGYEVDDIVVETKAGKEVEVTDKGEGKFTFKMPAANVTVSVDFAKADVEDGDAKDEVEYIQLTIDSVIAWVFDEFVANDVAPVIRNARTMLPARFVAEALGGVVTWDETEQKVTIVNGEDTIEIFIGEPFATVNGDPVELDSPAFIENDRTYLPIRFIAENMGATVTWDAADRTVTIVPGE